MILDKYHLDILIGSSTLEKDVLRELELCSLNSTKRTNNHRTEVVRVIY